MTVVCGEGASERAPWRITGVQLLAWPPESYDLPRLGSSKIRRGPRWTHTLLRKHLERDIKLAELP